MSASLWKQVPWLLGLLAAPLLFGLVNPEGQAVVGLLFAASLGWLATSHAGPAKPVLGPVWCGVAVALLLLPLLPLPTGWVAWLAPKRVELARMFPLEVGAAPGWLCLSLSPAGTGQRLWELGLIVSGFCLARQAAGHRGFERWLAATVICALLCLAASDIWFRLAGQRAMLGLWENRWHYGAGTFANRNHFANWMYVAGLFALGWLLRQLRPLHRARSEPLLGRQGRWGEIAFLGGVLLAGLTLAVATGSRSGFVAGLAGLAVWGLLLLFRSRSRTRWIWLCGGTLTAILMAVASSDLLCLRLATAAQHLPYKLSLWQQALRMAWEFPIFGTGWGTFVTAFNHFKAMEGGKTFWHAENDLVQLAAETGLAGLLVFGWGGVRLARRALAFTWRERMPEPELCFGAVAGLAAFVVHAQFEFVFQVTANALLAAVLLGFLIGSTEQGATPVVRPPPTNWRMVSNFAWVLLLGGVAVMQGGSFLAWHQAQRATNVPELERGIRRSLDRWPLAVERRVVLLRAQTQALAEEPPGQRPAAAEICRREFNRSLAWDPFNWQLRLERAWFDLNQTTNAARAQAEAWQVVRLNPLQAQIPLRFARYYSQTAPAVAVEFLRALDLDQTENLITALDLAWANERQTATLWSLAPNTVAGLLTLGDWAVGKQLYGLAAQAYQRVGRRADALVLAEKFLQAQHPHLALALLPSAPTDAASKWLLCRACLEGGKYPEAIRQAESLCLASRFRQTLLTPIPVKADLETLREAMRQQPKDLQAAQQLGEQLFQLPLGRRDLGELRELAERFPGQWRLAWLRFQAELEVPDYAAAAHTAARLAGHLRSLE